MSNDTTNQNPESGSTDCSKVSEFRCSSTQQNRDYLEQFEEDLQMLYGIVIEMVEDRPASLLSPVMRELLLDKAKLVKAKRESLLHKLRIDNPGGRDLKIV